MLISQENLNGRLYLMNCVRFEVWSFKSLSQMLFFFFSLDPQEIVRRLKCVHQRGTNFNLIFHEKKPTSDWCLPLGLFKANAWNQAGLEIGISSAVFAKVAKERPVGLSRLGWLGSGSNLNLAPVQKSNELKFLRNSLEKQSPRWYDRPWAPFFLSY